MSNTVITNYTDLNGPSMKSENSVVVIVNKDGSLSVDQKLLGTLMGSDSSQGAGISVVRVGHEGKPEDATDSESEDSKVPHVTLSVDSYYDEPNSIVKYDSGAEMLQSLRIETREKSLVGFQNDHCYTPFMSPDQTLPQKNEVFQNYDEPVIEIMHTPPPKPVPQSKKITILDQQIIPKGKKIVLNTNKSPKCTEALSKPLPALTKSKYVKESVKSEVISRSEENVESSSLSSSGDSVPDRDSDSDYKDIRTGMLKDKKSKIKPRILKSNHAAKLTKLEPKVSSRLKLNKNVIKREIREKIQYKKSSILIKDKKSDMVLEANKDKLPVSDPAISAVGVVAGDLNKSKSTPKQIKKEKRPSAALLSDMTTLFSTPDVIRRVSTDNKSFSKVDKDLTKNVSDLDKPLETSDSKTLDSLDKTKTTVQKINLKQKSNTSEKTKGYDLIPQLDDASLAQILQDNTVKAQTNIVVPSTISPGLGGPLSPTLDLLGGLQPEEEGLTEDLLMHVAQLVESSENLQEVIDKQVLGKVDTVTPKLTSPMPFQQTQQTSGVNYSQSPKQTAKIIPQRKDPIEIVRRDGRVITLPPIEAPATRSSKRKTQMEIPSTVDTVTSPAPIPLQPVITSPEPQIQNVSKQYVNKKMLNKKPDPDIEDKVLYNVIDKVAAESQESWNSEDDPNRLWCICKQPHNNRFMICCDGCEDWFHGKCVNITKAMGQQMEEQGVEWRCPNCVKKGKSSPKISSKVKTVISKKKEIEGNTVLTQSQTGDEKGAMSKAGCIVCKKPARSSSIYCSDACILKHAQDSLGSPSSTSKMDSTSGKQEKLKSDSRVIVYERKSGKLLAGPNAPTADNLKNWLQKNPTFEVVRPGTLSTIKPKLAKKSINEPKKVQTTLNFEKIPKKQGTQVIKSHTAKENTSKPSTPAKEEHVAPQPKTPVTPKSHQSFIMDNSKPNTPTAKTMSEPRKVLRASRSQSTFEKAASVSPATSRKKDTSEGKVKVSSTEPIRENVRKALQEQLTVRMAEYDGPKFSEEEIHQFAYETESELHELFKDVGMKYKAKYRSLMFNIKDRKNLSLWQKICDHTISPKQLVRLSPEELASQELAQWRDKEAKHQLELIKKSELDLLAASKTYVLKTHKGEEVMETKTSVSTELDPNVPVEDLVSALNDSTSAEEPSHDTSIESTKHKDTKVDTSYKKSKDITSNSKKIHAEIKHETDSRKSRYSKRKKSDVKEKEERSTRSSDKRKSINPQLTSKERAKIESSKEKSDSNIRSRRRSRSRTRTRRRSKEVDLSTSTSQARDRSRSRGRSKRRSRSKDNSRKRHRSRSSYKTSTNEKVKKRSKSQEHSSIKNKNDSTDSDSVERPKSAMLKEMHPEYDPHEPMITSAFSEEDLRKSEDAYEDTYKDELYSFGDSEYDPTKGFSISTHIISPTTTSNEKKDKSSGAESDQEPSSTVDNSTPIVWTGCINMVDVARFYVAAHEVSGSSADLEEDLSTELDIVGRINPDTVWDYISKMKRAGNKDIIILRLQAANDEEKMQYIALYSYLSSRNRLGVVKVSNTTTVKDFYIVPLPANTAVPPVLLPVDGPGLGEVKTHLLIAIVIRQRKKRTLPSIPKDVVPPKMPRESEKRLLRSSALPLPATYCSPKLSASVKEKIAASLACADDEEAYSPGGSSGSGNSVPSPDITPTNTLRSKMEELNRQIEEQKQQINKMAQADSSVGEEDEAYSPSRPMTPPSVVPLANIALPSNLQEILATIKQRSETSASVETEKRTLP